MTLAVETRASAVALNGDVVGYSRLLADDRDATTATMRRFRGIIESEVADAGGTVIDLAGDNFMAVFDEVIDAMRCAVAITTALEEENRDVPPHRLLRFRMGLDLGEMVVDDGQYFGDALNIAARIQSIARPGGVSVSGRVYTALDEPALRFRAAGPKKLKNIPEGVEVFELADLPSQPEAEPTSPISLEAPSIAVLPVHTEMVERDTLPLVESFRTELLHLLAEVPQLSVIDSRVGETERLSVPARYMLESGAHQVRDQIRIYANVVDVSTMNIVKSNRWSGSIDDLFVALDELAALVARDVEVELIVGAPARLYSDLNDAGAIQDIYMGWFHLTAGTPEGWSRSIDLFSKVMTEHPDQPYGYVLTGFSHWMGAAYDWSPDKSHSLTESRRLSRLGFEVGDPTGMAQMVEAAALMSEGKGDEALAAVEAAEIVRPTCDATYGIEGSVRRYLGQFEQAVGLEDTAMRLTGMNKPWYPTVKACSLLLGGRAEQAVSLAEAVIEHHPHNLEALLVLAAAQSRLGMDRRARATADLVAERFPGTDVEAWIDSNPYQDEESVNRWKDDLRSAGVLE